MRGCRPRDSAFQKADHGDGVPNEPQGAALDEGPKVARRQLKQPLGILGTRHRLLHEVLRQDLLLILGTHRRRRIPLVPATPQASYGLSF